MGEQDEAATARIPVKPTTLRRLRSTMYKGETYDDVVSRVAESRESCTHDFYRKRNSHGWTCRKCGAFKA